MIAPTTPTGTASHDRSRRHWSDQVLASAGAGASGCEEASRTGQAWMPNARAGPWGGLGDPTSYRLLKGRNRVESDTSKCLSYSRASFTRRGFRIESANP
ncbi:hypothetical protein GCM10023175_24860 [Pseudonocardia xishanensis]|uniref:Uncharacterized protein n=1 Tax=Pseudonocardia xishanensis TaxID=630995 RepID=A0ABP8RQM6_9PSEU